MKYSKKVIAVAVAHTQSLSTMVRTDVNHVTLDGNPFTNISIKVPGTLELSSKKDAKTDIYTAKLTFIQCDDRFDTVTHNSFLVTLADGEKIIIGGPERPFAVVTTGRNLSEGNSENQLLEVTVAYSSSEELPFLRQ